MELASQGVVGALRHVQEREEVKRQYFDRAVSLISSTVIPAIQSGISNVSLSFYYLLFIIIYIYKLYI